MADTQVDWGRLAWLLSAEPIKAREMDTVMYERWLRTTFEPLVTTAEAMLEDRCEHGNVKPCYECEGSLRAALDKLPKVGG